MSAVGALELKNRPTYYLRRARKGEEDIVTERGCLWQCCNPSRTWTEQRPWQRAVSRSRRSTRKPPASVRRAPGRLATDARSCPAAVQVYRLTEYHAKNAIALERLKTEFKGKVEVIQLPVSVQRDLKKLSAEIVREESEKTPMARKVYASFTKFQALVGPWDHVAEGAYHQFVAG